MLRHIRPVDGPAASLGLFRPGPQFVHSGQPVNADGAGEVGADGVEDVGAGKPGFGGEGEFGKGTSGVIGEGGKLPDIDDARVVGDDLNAPLPTNTTQS